MLIDERTQAVLVDAVYLARDELDACDIDGVVRLPRAAHRSLHLGLLQLAREALRFFLQRGDSSPGCHRDAR